MTVRQAIRETLIGAGLALALFDPKRAKSMSDEQLKVGLSQIDEGRDWLKFILGEYVKWYSAFLTLNLVALGFASSYGRPHMNAVAIAFILINIIGSILAYIVHDWAVEALRAADKRRAELLDAMDMKTPNVFKYPLRPVRFALNACVVTQAAFAAIWIGMLISGSSGSHTPNGS